MSLAIASKSEMQREFFPHNFALRAILQLSIGFVETLLNLRDASLENLRRIAFSARRTTSILTENIVAGLAVSPWAFITILLSLLRVIPSGSVFRQFVGKFIQINRYAVFLLERS